MAERNLRKVKIGDVVSDKMNKTIVVAVKDSVKHDLYKKVMKRTRIHVKSAIEYKLWKQESCLKTSLGD